MLGEGGGVTCWTVKMRKCREPSDYRKSSGTWVNKLYQADAQRVKDEYNLDATLVPMGSGEGKTRVNQLTLTDLRQRQIEVKDRLRRKVLHGVFAKQTEGQVRMCTRHKPSRRKRRPSVENVAKVKRRSAMSSPAVRNSTKNSTTECCTSQLAKTVLRTLGLKIPFLFPLKVAGGEVIGGGITGTPEARILINQVVPTDRTVDHRPYMVVRLTQDKRLIIFDVAYAWEPLVVEREREKR